MISVEKRSFIRTNINLPITFNTKSDPSEKRKGIVLNISIDGIFVQSDSSLSLGDYIELILPEQLGNIEVQAQVKRSQGNNYGCQFLDLSAETRKILDQTVYTLWKKGNNQSLSG